MKKFVKMSLVAAVAVAGLTSANAKPLEEAIKDVDVSGTVVYRYNDYSNDQNGAATSDNTGVNHYKIGLSLSSKVNDDVKLNTRFIVGSTTDAGFVALDTSSGDGQANITLSQVNFAYTGIANTTVIAGKQGLGTPWTIAVDSDSNEQTGTGLLALSNLGPVTVAAAYFNQTNLNTSGNVKAGNGAEDVTAAAVIVPVGPVTLDAWYLDRAKVYETFTVGAKAALDMDGIKLGAEARYTDLDLDSATTDNSMMKLVLTADAGLIDAKLAYASTDADGGLVAEDDDATTSLIGWNIAANNKADLDYFQVVVGVDALENLNVSANYGYAEYGVNVEEEEMYVQALYSMSKNLTTYVRYGTYTKDTGSTSNNDDTRGRLQIQYSF